MASVAKRIDKSGKTVYQAIWWADIGGKRKQQSKRFDRKREAEAHAQTMALEVESKGVIDVEKHTVGQFLRRWLATLEVKGEHSPTTLEGYGRCIEMISRHVGDVLLSRLTAQHLDVGYTALLQTGGKSKVKDLAKPKLTRPLSARTVLHVHRAVHTALEQARKWKLVAENVARDATPPSPKKAKVRSLSESEIVRVLEAAQYSDELPRTYPGLGMALELALVTGVRRSELLGLAWDCVDFNNGTIEIRRTVILGADKLPLIRDGTKTDESARVISVPASTMEKLARHRGFIMRQKIAFGREYASGPLLCFPDRGGAARIPSTMSTAFRQVMRRANIDGVQPTHVFRHTQASMLIKHGADVKTVSTRLGHSTTRITLDLYTHSDRDQDQAAAQIAGSLLSLGTAK